MNSRHDLARESAMNIGLAVTLIFLLVAVFHLDALWLRLGIASLVLVMVWPTIWKPLIPVWNFLLKILEWVMPRIVLGVVFFVVVVPVALARRLFGADSLQLSEWKKGRKSVFVDRNHRFTIKDLAHPY